MTFNDSEDIRKRYFARAGTYYNKIRKIEYHEEVCMDQEQMMKMMIEGNKSDRSHVVL